MKFNEKLIKLRKEKLLSQEELAEKLGVTRQTISKWELEQTTPDMDKLQQISKIFNISIDELLNEEETAKSNNSKEKKSWRNTIIVIILFIVLFAAIFGVGLSIFNRGKNTKTNIEDNRGIVERMVDSFFGTFLNVIDKTIDKSEKINEKLDQRTKEEREKNYNEMRNWYDNETNKMKEESENRNKEIENMYYNALEQMNIDI